MLARRTGPRLVSREEAKARPSKKSTPVKPKTARLKAAVKVGSRIRHKSFGEGVVRAIQDDVITVGFPEHGTRKMVLSALLERGLIEL